MSATTKKLDPKIGPDGKRLPKGIRRMGAGFQTYVRINGQLHAKSDWPITTPITVLQEWIATQKKTYGDVGPNAGSFAADVIAYAGNGKVAGGTIKRHANCVRVARRLAWWVTVLGGDRSRYSITDTDVVAGLTRLLDAGKAPGTARNYKIALQGFFTAMDPKRANPTRGTCKKELRIGKLPKRGRDMITIDRLVAGMADRKRGRVSKAKFHARIMAATGLPPALIGKITATDLIPSPMAATHVVVAPRIKGTGVESRTLELLSADGPKVFAEFHAAKLYGPVNTRSLRAAFVRSASKLGVFGIRAYDIRHSFLTQLYRDTRDLSTVAYYAMHAEGSPLTARYALAAREDVNAAAVVAYRASEAQRRADATAATGAALEPPAPATRARGGRRLRAKVESVKTAA